MKIMRLVVDDFAQLDHVEIDFHEGSPNLISGPNEAGKSHIMQALYGVFFGLDDPEQYRPWFRHDSVPRARLEFGTDAGVHVRLDRDFQSHRVTVEQEGEPAWSTVVGPHTRIADEERYYTCLQRWLGFVDARVFTATTFVRQSDVVGASLSGIAAQVKFLITGTRDSNSDRGLATLRKELETLGGPGVGAPPRLIEQKEQFLAELEHRYRDTCLHQDRMAGLEEQLRHREVELDRAEQKRARLLVRLETMEEIVQNEHAALALDADIRDLQAHLDQFATVHERIQQAEIDRNRFAAITREDPETLMHLERAVREAQSHFWSVEEEFTSRPAWRRAWPWIVVAAAALAGIFLAIFFKAQMRSLSALVGDSLISPLGVALCVAVAVFLLMAWTFGLLQDRPHIEPAQIRDARAMLDHARQERDRVFTNIGVSSIDDVVTLRKKADETNRVLDQARQDLNALGDEQQVIDAFEAAQSRAKELRHTVTTSLERDAGEHGADDPSDPIELSCRLRHRIQDADTETRQLRDRRDGLMRELLVEEEHERDPIEIAEEISAIRTEIAGMRRRRDALAIAINTLQTCATTFYDHYLDPVTDEASALLSALTDGRYTRVLLERDSLEPRVGTSARHDIPVERLSRGVQDQLYFSLRVALAHALSSGHSLPLILDDPYVNLDLARLHRTISLLRDLGRQTQIILFSCHPQYEQWFEPILRLPAPAPQRSAVPGSTVR
ncbi:MAG: hypothetical protein NVS2B16_11540 [Chloroflexota bacterium]